MTYNTTGIILNYRDVGEFDRIYNILTHDNGKVDAWAQGVRKPKSKLVAHLQPLYLCDFMFARGRRFDRIAQVRIQNRFPEIWKDLDKLAKGVYVTSLTELVIHPGTKERMVFELLSAVMNLLEKGDGALDAMFALKLLKETGFSPELQHCVLCKARVEGLTRSFDAIRGGVLCSDCFIHSGAESIPISSLTLETIDTILSSPLTRLEMPETLISEMGKIVDKMVHAHFGEEPKARRFIKGLPMSNRV
jgi:DNA repair protein RecO (recombination protein O)